MDVVDAEATYAQARAMLEDRTIQDVSIVPMMLEICAHAGHEPAKILLLDVYEGKRKGLDAEPEKAFALACSMAEATLPLGASREQQEARLEAMYRRALYHERGFGSAPSPADAYLWMRRAAVEGLSKAQVELSRYLMNGVGHAPAPQEALLILRSVSTQAPHTPNLFFYLGHMCLNGMGLRRPNTLMARRYFELGMQVDDARAINNLASMYELGIGVSKDVGMALRLYKRAAALGCKDASANMQRLAYKTDHALGDSALWQQRVGRAALRVVQALPLSPALQRLLSSPFMRLSSES